MVPGIGGAGAVARGGGGGGSGVPAPEVRTCWKLSNIKMRLNCSNDARCRDYTVSTVAPSGGVHSSFYFVLQPFASWTFSGTSPEDSFEN